MRASAECPPLKQKTTMCGRTRCRPRPHPLALDIISRDKIDQLRRRMGQHWRCARMRGRGGGCEVFRAPPSLGRQLEARQRAKLDAEPRPRARWSTHFSPRTYVPLTRRLRRAVAVWPEEEKSPGSRLRLPFFGDVTFFYTATAPPALARRRLARRRQHARRRHARRRACAAPPAPSLRRAACAALPLPRRLRRAACAATPHAAPPRAATPRPAPPRTAPPRP